MNRATTEAVAMAVKFVIESLDRNPDNPVHENGVRVTGPDYDYYIAFRIQNLLVEPFPQPAWSPYEDDE